MKRLSTLTRACKPIAPRHHFIPIRTISTALRNPTKPSLNNTTSSSLTKRPHQSPRYASTTTAEIPSAPLSKTALYDFHIANGAKMVPFSDFHMPVQYDSLSVLESHHFTRSHCSLFDVSHMVQHDFRGPGALAFLEKITPMGIKDLKVGQSGLSTLLKPETGGIIDDTIIAKIDGDAFYVVTNAGCRKKDLAYLKEQLGEWDGEKVEWNVLNDHGLIAIQGPKSEKILQSVISLDLPLKEMFFGSTVVGAIPLGNTKVDVRITRGGYTGEDGFEVSVHNRDLEAVTKFILEAGAKDIALAGLGARDSLRLEAGMCLYGHDLNEEVTPVEASLSWIIGKDRKIQGGFHGDKVILSQLKPKSKGGAGVSKRRIGIIVEGAPAREGATILNAQGDTIGEVTSGCPSPSLKKNIAMGYVQDGFHKAGTEVDVLVRGKKRKGVVTKMPFVPTKYWKGVAPA